MSTQVLPLRKEVPPELTWDLSTIYKTDADWEADFSRLSSLLPAIENYKGNIGQSGTAMLEALKYMDTVGELEGKLHVYAHMRLHEDTTSSHYQALSDRITTLGSKISAAAAYINPEILSIKDQTLQRWIASTPGLELYRHYLDELTSMRPHIRTDEIESLLAQAGELSSTADRVYSLLTDADFKLPQVADAQGVQIQLTDGNYLSRFLQSKDRGERKRGFQAMLGIYNAHRNTIAGTYSAQVKADIFYARARKYSSCLEHALDSIHVPVSVYTTLIETVEKNLPLLHRYLRLRKRVLGLEELHMYDLYVPIVQNVDYKVAFDEAKEKVLEGLQPLGQQYLQELRKGMDSRWIDVLETPNKRSGAYSWGSYSTNPFMLLNYQENLESMFTLAHEAGHSMHSFFTRKNQPYRYGDYTLFVAEVASICNEALLTAHLLKTSKDKSLRAYVINHALEEFRTTLYRQTLFAEFEMEAHRLAESGEALTPELLCQIFKGINDKYYAAAVCVDEEIEIEWARIPHFYSSFYVYQYATGLSAAHALAGQILKEGQPAVERYLRFLSSGSCDYSINLLQKAGVDLLTPQPIQQALESFGHYLDEFEQELC